MEDVLSEPDDNRHKVWCKRRKIPFNESVRSDINSTIQTFCIEARTKDNKCKEKPDHKEKRDNDLTKIVDSEDDNWLIIGV